MYNPTSHSTIETAFHSENSLKDLQSSHHETFPHERTLHPHETRQWILLTETALYDKYDYFGKLKYVPWFWHHPPLLSELKYKCEIKVVIILSSHRTLRTEPLVYFIEIVLFAHMALFYILRTAPHHRDKTESAQDHYSRIQQWFELNHRISLAFSKFKILSIMSTNWRYNHNVSDDRGQDRVHTETWTQQSMTFPKIENRWKQLIL